MPRTSNTVKEDVIKEKKTVAKAAVSNPEREVQNAELRRRSLIKTYKDEKLIPVSVPPLYKPYFGESMVVTINGITIAIPCNGRTYNIAESFACEVLTRINKTNEIIEKGKSMANVIGNFEKSPGELKFF